MEVGRLFLFASAKSLLTRRSSSAIIKAYGALAQLGARHIRIVKARGSTPLCSTNPILHKTLLLCRWLCRHGLVVISKPKNQRILCSLVLWFILSYYYCVFKPFKSIQHSIVHHFIRTIFIIFEYRIA